MDIYKIICLITSKAINTLIKSVIYQSESDFTVPVRSCHDRSADLYNTRTGK